MNSETPKPGSTSVPKGQGEAVDSQENEKTSVRNPGTGDGSDAPTRIVPGRNETEDSPTRIPEPPTRLLDQTSPPTRVLERQAEADAQGATRVLPSTPLRSGHSGVSPQTNVSMPVGEAPKPPAATSVSISVDPIVQVGAPRTGASASPSSARTAGSAADRDELPKTGDFIKERFELVQELGRGGMGAVFRARDMRKMEALDPDPFVAIKFISGNLVGFEKAFVALQREAKNAQELNHPNIVKVFDFDRDSNLVYLTMEVVEGVALNTRMRESTSRPLGDGERTHLAHGMLAGMSYAHSRELSHADLKPSNMMIDKNGDLKILDFGIARRREYDTVFDADDLFALTIDYASPEMLNRQRPTPADDVYALGCIIYYLHAGAHPFNHVRADVARNEKMRPVRPASMNRVQWQAVRKALAFTREQRFADAAEFQRAFEAPDWRKIGGVSSAVLALMLVVGWFAADPIQSWLTVSGLDQPQAAALQQGLKDGSEYLSSGYGEDAVYAFSEALAIDPHNGTARSGLGSALTLIQSRMPDSQYRAYLQSQLTEERNGDAVKDIVLRKLGELPVEPGSSSH